MRRTKIKLKTIFNIIQTIIKENPLMRGRPRIYSDPFIISIFLYQTLMDLSYREALDEAKYVFKKFPALSTYHYRISKLPKEYLTIIIQELSKKIIKKEGNFLFSITDGTGFSYDNLYPLRFLRGTEIRMVKSHIRVVPIIGVSPSGKRIIITAESGGPYCSETKLLLKVLSKITPDTFRTECLIADKCYDSIEVMKKLVQLRVKPAIRVKETFRRKVKNPLRKESKFFWNKWGKKRRLIESLFAIIKQKLGSHFKVKKEDIAEKKGLAVFLSSTICISSFIIYICFYRYIKKFTCTPK